MESRKLARRFGLADYLCIPSEWRGMHEVVDELVTSYFFEEKMMKLTAKSKNET